VRACGRAGRRACWQAGGRATGWPGKHEQGGIVYIINVKLPNLELQPQGISYQERERETQSERETLCNVAKFNRISGLPRKLGGGQSRGRGA
jgi:hypothetical protein